MQPKLTATTAFPPTPPPSLTDPRSIAEHDWDAFAQITEMKNHWDRPGWTNATRRYYWFITIENSPELLASTQACQETIRPLGLDPVPLDGLHITIAKIGDTADVGKGALDRLAEIAADRFQHLRPLDLQAIPMTGSRGAIRYSLAPWTGLLDLHLAVTGACRDLGLRSFKSNADLRPHLGIAYANRSIRASLVRKLVEPLRRQEPVHLRIGQVQLVELRRENAAYRWTTHHSAQLGPKGMV